MMVRDGSSRRRKQEPKLVAEIQPWLRNLQVELSINGIGKSSIRKSFEEYKVWGMIGDVEHGNFNRLQLLLWK